MGECCWASCSPLLFISLRSSYSELYVSLFTFRIIVSFVKILNFRVNYWLSKGAPKSKLIVGIPTFGRLWKLCSSSTNIGSRGCGPGTPGSIIWDQEGFLSYQEICLELSNGWTVVDDDTGSRGPYAFKGNQWVGYDDPFAAGRKAKYIGDNDLGGAMIWDLSSDDFNGRCPRGKYPMISTVTNVFKV